MFYFHVAGPYAGLRERHPGTLAENLETTVRINDAARGDRAARLRALADDHDDPPLTLSDALGAGLGAHFRAAPAAGRLPRTAARRPAATGCCPGCTTPSTSSPGG